VDFELREVVEIGSKEDRFREIVDIWLGRSTKNT
jgi:hypothetical protein